MNEIIVAFMTLAGTIAAAAFGYKQFVVKGRTDQTKNFLNTVIDQNHKLQARVDKLENNQQNLKDKILGLKSIIPSLKLFGKSSPIAIWVKDREGRRLHHNQAYEDLTGYVLSDCHMKHDSEIVNNEKVARNWKAMDLRVISEKREIVEIELCNHKDLPDDLFQVFTIKWPAIIQGQVVGVEGAAIRMDLIGAAMDRSEKATQNKDQ